MAASVTLDTRSEDWPRDATVPVGEAARRGVRPPLRRVAARWPLHRDEARDGEPDRPHAGLGRAQLAAGPQHARALIPAPGMPLEPLAPIDTRALFPPSLQQPRRLTARVVRIAVQPTVDSDRSLPAHCCGRDRSSCDVGQRSSRPASLACRDSDWRDFGASRRATGRKNVVEDADRRLGEPGPSRSSPRTTL